MLKIIWNIIASIGGFVMAHAVWHATGMTPSMRVTSSVSLALVGVQIALEAVKSALEYAIDQMD